MVTASSTSYLSKGGGRGGKEKERKEGREGGRDGEKRERRERERDRERKREKEREREGKREREKDFLLAVVSFFLLSRRRGSIYIL